MGEGGGGRDVGGGREQGGGVGGGRDQNINAIFYSSAAELYSWSKAIVSVQ